MKKVNKLLAIVLAFAVLLTGFAKEVEAVAGESSTVVERLEGLDRVKTSIKVSNEVYPDGSAENAVLAGWEGEVDALTATLLASVKDAPLLLVRDKQYSTIKDELDRLGVKKVYLAGGTTVVSKQLEQQLKKDKYSVERVSGDNRYHTAAAIMKETGVHSKHVFLVNGGAENKDQLVDALAAGPVSGGKNIPILLTLQNSVPKATLDALKGVDQITIIGGNAAVSAQVAKQLKDKGYKVDRVEGANRYQTAVEISKKYFGRSTKSILVNDGKGSLADALVGGYLGAKKGIPILLTDGNQLTGHTKTYVENKMISTYILGGVKSISSNVFDNLDEIMNPARKRKIESIEKFADIAVKFAGVYRLPEKVEIRLNNKEVVSVPVNWSDKDVNINKAGVYKVPGNLDLSGIRDIEEAAKKQQATINVVIAPKVEVDAEVDKKPFRVVLDYGHGGKDPGAVYNGRREKDDTLRLGRLITAELRRQGIFVDETRTEDVFVDLPDISGFANRNGRDYYNYFISIHRNSASSNTAHGSETFVHTTRNPLSIELATDIQKGLTNVGFVNRGVKYSNFHVLRATYAPALLVEVGFINNASDNKLFDNNLDKIAKSIADSVVRQSK